MAKRSREARTKLREIEGEKERARDSRILLRDAKDAKKSSLPVMSSVRYAMHDNRLRGEERRKKEGR